MIWTEHADSTLRMFLENMVAESSLAQKYGLEASPQSIVDASREALWDVIHRSIPLARVMDQSDLVLHAEGPGVKDDSPSLSAFNWLAGTAEQTIRRLSGSLFDLLERDARQLGKALDLRVTGIAPGSLYMGFALLAPQGGLIASEDEPVFAEIREALHLLPVLTGAIGEEEISPAASEMVPDAAERDAVFTALHRLSPTGKRGIHTLDLTAPNGKGGTLSQRERTVLADALRRPNLTNRKHGKFAGEVREIDLDTQRMQLRHVTNVGSLRCVLPALSKDKAKHLLGELVSVTGDYESDRNGRPRLILVEEIQELPKAAIQVDLIGASRLTSFPIAALQLAEVSRAADAGADMEAIAKTLGVSSRELQAAVDLIRRMPDALQRMLKRVSHANCC